MLSTQKSDGIFSPDVVDVERFRLRIETYSGCHVLTPMMIFLLFRSVLMKIEIFYFFSLFLTFYALNLFDSLSVWIQRIFKIFQFCERCDTVYDPKPIFTFLSQTIFISKQKLKKLYTKQQTSSKH